MLHNTHTSAPLPSSNVPALVAVFLLLQPLVIHSLTASLFSPDGSTKPHWAKFSPPLHLCNLLLTLKVKSTYTPNKEFGPACYKDDLKKEKWACVLLFFFIMYRAYIFVFLPSLKGRFYSCFSHPG